MYMPKGKWRNYITEVHTMKNNTYFEELKRIGHEWEAARVERKARKQQIIDTLGWTAKS